MRKRLTVLPLIALMLIFGGWYHLETKPVSDKQEKVTFTISSGQGIDKIGQGLVDVGLVRSVFAFKVQVALMGVSRKIQAGDFTLSPNMDLKKIVSSLTTGRSDIQVTLLEGWRREEVAREISRVLGENSNFDPEDFVTLTASVEGQLFPDTYAFQKNSSTQKVVNTLTDTFRKKTEGLDNRSGLIDSQALVLASIIEREGRNAHEKPVIAGILLQRLEGKWPIQADATVQYLKASQICRKLDCEWWPKSLTRDDLAIRSPYNTYLNTGLPPQPIANPSLESIKAAYQPESVDYWFYLHDSTGQVHYAKTIEEHNQNIANYLK